MKALILDDSRTVRMLLRRMLQSVGCVVFEAENGLEGLRRLKEVGKIDFATVDWQMPVMDGLGFVRAVRTEFPDAAIPLIMVTTLNDLEHVSLALAAGANEYLMKPFTEEMVREKLALLGVLQD
jgi:two-component system, chemotaxis family, chemotaxis protein CheY